MDQNSYERGRELLRRMFGEIGEATLASVAKTAPDLARWIAEFAFGEVMARPGLDLKSREIANVAALAALGTAPQQLRAHIHGALNVGCTPQEVVEVLMQMALYAGFPAALNGVAAAREVFAERAARR